MLPRFDLLGSTPLVTRAPILATIIATMLTHETRAILVVKPNILPIHPLHQRKLEIRCDTLHNFGNRAPGSCVLACNNLVLLVAPAHTNMWFVIDFVGQSVNGASTRYFARVPFALGKVSVPLRTEGQDCELTWVPPAAAVITMILDGQILGLIVNAH